MNNMYMFFWLLRKVPFYIISEIINSVSIYLASYIGNVYFLRIILGKLETHASLSEMIYPLLGLALFFIFSSLYSSLFTAAWSPKNEIKIEKILYQKLFKKAEMVELSRFDDPAYYDNFIFSSNSILDCVKKAVSLISNTIAQLINVVLVILAYAKTTWEMILLIILSTLVTFILKSIIAKISYERDIKLVPAERKMSYFCDIFISRDAVKDRKMTEVDTILENKYDENNESKISILKQFNKKLSRLNWLQEYVCDNLLMRIGLIFVLTLNLLIKREILLSEFVPLYNGADVLASGLISFFGTYIPELMDNGRRIGRFRTFINAKNDVCSQSGYIPLQTPEEIEFRNVSFRYPNHKEFVLKDINVKLEPGKVYALVGRNGAGKSTLAAVLSGLYLPTSGALYVGGHAMEETDRRIYQSRFNSVYQKDELLSATIGENIALSQEYDMDKVSMAAQRSGIVLAEKKMTPHTHVGREMFDDGIYLSGGEVQKILIARSFYRGLPYMVLDEPSAALDAQAEYEFNQMVAQIGKQSKKTILIITHRLTTVAMADQILVMENGNLVEQGTFKELKSRQGLFKQMWEAQAKKYEVNERPLA